MSHYIKFDLDTLFDHQFFSKLDYFFARSMASAFAEKNPIVLVSCALVSKALSEGHICIDIPSLSGKARPVSETGDDLVTFPDFTTWKTALKSSPVISDSILTPCVLDSDHRLYFSKYYDFQNRLSETIAQRALLPLSDTYESSVDRMLDSCFTENNAHTTPQRNAVKSAVLNHFTLISGGPGTGKTYVTGMIKKLFVSLAEEFGLAEPKIISVAPTGKAASKMEQGSTIHSVLKPLRSGPGFYHNKTNLLQADVIIIDEASMIDITLFTRLLEAVPLTAHVIILGDNHQLASIQAGTVFQDICSVNRLSTSVFDLKYNFRSKGKTGIENLAKAINRNDAQSLEAILTSGQYPDVVYETIDTEKGITTAIKKHVLEGYNPFCRTDTVDAALNELESFKILCAHNSGEYGTLQINHVCENILRSEDNFDIQERFFKRIVMVNTNDYEKGLFNGDTGIIFEKKEGVNTFFIGQDNQVKPYRASDLPGTDTAFAMTIHKSQGSEFDTVLILVPDRLSPVITRQLLYTGVTRAKTKVIIMGSITVIKKAIRFSVKRHSGVSACLEQKLLRQ